MAVDAIIKGAVWVQQQIPGISAAYIDAPTSLSQLPCFVTYPGTGEIEWPRRPSARTITHDLNMDLYVQKGGDVQAADRILKPFIDNVIATFDQNLTLNGTAFNSGVIKYQYGVLEYAGVQYLGIKFVLRAMEYAQVVYKK
jgi:hypothetical protein